jgi:hypothetical protein
VKRFLLGLAALPFLAGAASAAEVLNNTQMDVATAGFSAQSIADAQAFGKIVAASAATVAQVGPVTTGDQMTIGFSVAPNKWLAVPPWMLSFR